jgi:hypothetical protein
VWADGAVDVTVPTLRGFRYELQAKTNLTDLSWNPLTEVLATNPWSEMTLPDTSADQRKFYRVRIR